MRSTATAVIYQMTATDWLTPAEAARLWPPAGIYTASVDLRHFEAAITAARLLTSQCIRLHGEWREPHLRAVPLKSTASEFGVLALMMHTWCPSISSHSEEDGSGLSRHATT